MLKTRTQVSAPMPITLLCPNLTCRAVLQVPDKVRGKQIRCGKCGCCFLVPGGPMKSQPAAPVPSQPPAPPTEP